MAAFLQIVANNEQEPAPKSGRRIAHQTIENLKETPMEGARGYTIEKRLSIAGFVIKYDGL
jgi:hypothetical protein